MGLEWRRSRKTPHLRIFPLNRRGERAYPAMHSRRRKTFLNYLRVDPSALPRPFFDETYLSRRLMEALTPAVKLEGLGNKMCIEIFITVLQSDGCVLNAAVAGASLALSDAGVGMRDLVCASSAAIMKVEDAEQKVSYRAIADPTEEEVLQALGLVTIAMMPNWREVTVLDQFGKMPLDGSSEAMDLARDGCVTLHRLLKNCLVNGYSRS